MIDPTDSVTLALPQPSKVRFIGDGRVMTATLDQDLFGDWMLTQAWSGTHGRRGRGKMTLASSFEEGMALLQALARKLGKNGYQLAA